MALNSFLLELFLRNLYSLFHYCGHLIERSSRFGKRLFLGLCLGSLTLRMGRLGFAEINFLRLLGFLKHLFHLLEFGICLLLLLRMSEV